MMLHGNILGEGRPFIILHGFLGMGDNWKTLGQKFSDLGYEVHLIDQRNHGRSFHDNGFSYEEMVLDLKHYIDTKDLNDIVLLGHSMGGKTAMVFAANSPHLVDRLIVADIGPQSYPVHHSTILKGLFSIDLEKTTSRKEADDLLSQFVPEMGVRQFLLKNLTRSEGGFTWRINLPVIAREIEQIGKGLNHNTSYDKPTLFIRGERSDYITDTDINLIHSIFKNSKVQTIAGAGHWLHAEKPAEFYEKVMSFLI